MGRLRQQMAGSLAGPSARTIWSTGLPALDELLPDRGVRAGSIVEWLAEAGGGASTLAWLMARHLQRQRRSVIVIDPAGEFFPPGVAHLGVDLGRVIVVRSAPSEALWAMEQSLRSEVGGVVVGRVERLSQQAFRRLKLAAERGGGIGLFLRRCGLALILPGRTCGSSWSRSRTTRVSPLMGKVRRSMSFRWAASRVACGWRYCMCVVEDFSNERR